MINYRISISLSIKKTTYSSFVFVFDIVENRCFRSQWPWPLGCDEVFYIKDSKYRVMSIFIPCLVSSVLKMWEWQAIILHRNKEDKHFNDLWWPWPLTLGYEIFTIFLLCEPYVCTNWTVFEHFLLMKITLKFTRSWPWPLNLKTETILIWLNSDIFYI